MTLKELRKSKGLTQNVLATKIGKKQSVVGMWESGKSKPKLDSISKIAKALETTNEVVLSCFE